MCSNCRSTHEGQRTSCRSLNSLPWQKPLKHQQQTVHDIPNPPHNLPLPLTGCFKSAICFSFLRISSASLSPPCRTNMPPWRWTMKPYKGISPRIFLSMYRMCPPAPTRRERNSSRIQSTAKSKTNTILRMV